MNMKLLPKCEHFAFLLLTVTVTGSGLKRQASACESPFRLRVGRLTNKYLVPMTCPPYMYLNTYISPREAQPSILPVSIAR